MFETMQSLDFSLLDLIAARRFGAATNALTVVTVWATTAFCGLPSR